MRKNYFMFKMCTKTIVKFSYLDIKIQKSLGHHNRLAISGTKSNNSALVFLIIIFFHKLLCTFVIEYSVTARLRKLGQHVVKGNAFVGIADKCGW